MPIQVTIPKGEFWDKKAKRLLKIPKPITVTLEHSLISISKWEEKWHYSYFSKKREKSTKEILDYMQCMIIGKPIPAEYFSALSEEDKKRVADYMKDPHSALRISDKKESAREQLVTSEHIYYSMVAYQIPFEAQTWHINRLMTFIKLCQIKNESKDKRKRHTMSEEARLDRARLNAERRKSIGSKG